MVTRTHLNVTLHLHCLSQNTPMTEDLLTAQDSQCTFWTLISSLAITAARYIIVRDSDHFLLLYSPWGEKLCTTKWRPSTRDRLRVWWWHWPKFTAQYRQLKQHANSGCAAG